MIKKGRVANFTELIRGLTANFESLPDCHFFVLFFFQLVDVPLVNSEGKMLLPPAELGKGCPTPVYANPRQVLRILKRREAKKRLARSGKLKNRAKRVCMAAQ